MNQWPISTGRNIKMNQCKLSQKKKQVKLPIKVKESVTDQITISEIYLLACVWLRG